MRNPVWNRTSFEAWLLEQEDRAKYCPFVLYARYLRNFGLTDPAVGVLVSEYVDKNNQTRTKYHEPWLERLFTELRTNSRWSARSVLAVKRVLNTQKREQEVALHWA